MLSKHTSNIFISYRRSDTKAWAGRIYDRLNQHFERESLYMDVDSIELGLDFFEAIEDTLKSCNVFLAIIGRDWLETSDEHGRRIDNPDDLVRHEISTALKRNIRVIPILVDNASIPSSRDLPDELTPLVRRNAFAIRHESFHTDVERLIKAVQSVIKKEEERKRAKTEAKRKTEERKRTEAEAKRKAEEEQRKHVEELAKRKAEEVRKAEEARKAKQRRAEVEPKRKIQEERTLQEADLQEWRAACQEHTCEAYKTYATSFPKGKYYEVAVERYKRLKPFWQKDIFKGE